MRYLVMDIETRPNPLMLADAEFWAAKAAELQAPSNYKDPLKIEEWKGKALQKTRDEMALQASTGIVVMAGLMDLESEEGPTIFEATEKNLLLSISDWLDGLGVAVDYRLVGFNLRQFDVPYLWGRCMVQKQPIFGLPFPKDYRRVIDLRELLGAGSLDDWRVAMGLGPKKVTGADLLTISMEELKEHLLEDMVATHEIGRRLLWDWMAEENRRGSYSK